MESDVTFVPEMQRMRPEKSEVFRLWCDNTLVHELTGFKPEFSLEQGLRKTVEWFLNPQNLSKYKTNLYNV
jgi:nucleoside-diphosphate-sugar epimerase